MNRILIAATAGFLALSGAAAAMTNATATLQAEVDNYVRGVDLDTLSDGQVNAIKLAVHSGDGASQIRAFINSIVAQ